MFYKKSVFVFLTSTLLLLSSLIGKAQPWLDKLSDADKKNFYAIQSSFNNYWKGKEKRERLLSLFHKRERNEGFVEDERPGYMQFKRWENLWSKRVFPTGAFPDPTLIFNEYNKQKQRTATLRTTSNLSSANWTEMNPSGVPSGGGGAGRLNVIRVDPNNPNTIWVGSPSGGLWKSIDGGTTWSTPTDLLATLGVADIAIHPTQPNTLFVVTGDCDATDTYSLGIIKSTDGGITWTTTGLTYDVTQEKTLRRVVINALNPDIILATSLTGLYRSTDGGVTFTYNNFASNMRTIELNPLNPNTVYGVSGTTIRKSTNAGKNWKVMTGNSSGFNATNISKMAIALTANDTNVIYVLASDNSNGFHSIWKSINGGTTWQQMFSQATNGVNLLGWDVSGGDSGGQAFYTLSIGASSTNKDEVYVGGVNIWKSSDGGASFSCNAHWTGSGGRPYVHADIHNFEFLRNDGNTLYAASDGGIFKTTNGGNSWVDLSDGLHIQQFYKLGCSVTNPNRVSCGAQDNGTALYDGTSNWRSLYGGDGMETAIDYTDENTIYAEVYNGGIIRSDDGGYNWTNAAPNSGTGAWVTPYILHPTIPSTIYVGFDDVYKSTNKGASYTNITNGALGNSSLDFVNIAPSNPDYIYAGNLSSAYRSINGGISWSALNNTLGGTGITDLAISNTNPNLIWVTVSGYIATDKVFKSTDGGMNWTNVSTGLPNVPVNCIVYEKNTPDALYAGTDLGVYYINSNMITWVPYNDGLPNVKIDELEIQYAVSKIRAATYGRGLWEADLYVVTSATDDAGCASIDAPTGNVCSNTITPQLTIKNFGSNNLTAATINYTVNGNNFTYSWSGNLAPLATSSVTLPSINLNAGVYTFNASTALPNGNTDGNNANDLATGTFTIIGSTGLALPFSEGFENPTFPNNGITIYNPDNGIAWTRTTAAAKTGSGSAFLENANYQGGNGKIDDLILPSLDLTSTATPKLYFDVAYTYWTTPIQWADTLAILLSTDCGVTYQSIYKKWGDNLKTATPQASDFVPTASQWRTDSVDLSNYSNITNVSIKFRNISDYENNLYLDNININSALPNNIAKVAGNETITIFPNPSNGNSFIKVNKEDRYSISVTNAIGQEIWQEEIVAGANKPIALAMQNWSKGIYTVSIKSSQDTFIKKITLQ